MYANNHTSCQKIENFEMEFLTHMKWKKLHTVSRLHKGLPVRSGAKKAKSQSLA